MKHTKHLQLRNHKRLLDPPWFSLTSMKQIGQFQQVQIVAHLVSE
jgi:hypothetical protein